MRHLLVILPAVLGLLASACGGSPSRHEYTLRGQILAVAPDRLEASIKHEEIPGFMGAMTMSYKGKDATELANVKPGDLITSTLVIVSNGAYLEHVRKTGEAPLEPAPASVPAAPASSGFELLRPGDPVPNATFVDQDGKALEFVSLQGSPLLVTFIYTSCPLPSFCPLMDRHFVAIQMAVKRDAALKDVKLVSVSIDPVADTPAVLTRHAASIGADPAHWRFLTGHRDELDRFAARFGVAITREQSNPLDISHNLRTALIDATGQLVKAYTGNEWKPADVLEDLSALLRDNKG
jgi:protein SCO1/2